MKILKQGKPQAVRRPVELKGTCTRCECEVANVLLAECEVLENNSGGDNDGTFLYVVCPTANCGNWIFVK
jgi:hypothetical protein